MGYEKMQGYQRRYLKGRAHKIKFIDFKEKSLKNEVTLSIEKKTDSELVGMIGHIAIYYRPQKDPEKRKIHLPEK
jgi:RNA-binding protein